MKILFNAKYNPIQTNLTNKWDIFILFYMFFILLWPLFSSFAFNLKTFFVIISICPGKSKKFAWGNNFALKTEICLIHSQLISKQENNFKWWNKIAIMIKIDDVLSLPLFLPIEEKKVGLFMNNWLVYG